MKRLIWNIYTAILIAKRCDVNIKTGWQCAIESDILYQCDMWPTEVARIEAGHRKVEPQ